MKHFWTYSLCLAMFLLVVGCGSDKDELLPEPEPTPSGASIEFEGGNPPTIVVSSEGGISTLAFTATGAWTAEVNAVTRAVDWISVSPTSGGPSKVDLQIKIQPNETYEERNAAITLRCGSTTKTVTVTQKQKDALLVTSNKVELDVAGGEFAIEVQANVSISVEMEETARSWISSVATRGLNVSTLRFTAKENEDIQPRQAVITIKGGDLVEEVTVYQVGSGPAIVLSQKEYTVSSVGEIITVELKSNTAYKVMMPDVNWVNEVDTRAFSAYTHYYRVVPNDTYDTRTAEIVFVDEVNGLKEAVTITQMQQDAIVVAKEDYIVPATGGPLDFSVNTNVDFSVETSASWIRQVDTRGLVEKPLHFIIAENIAETLREGVITLRSGELEQEIKVTQEGKAEIPLLVLGQTAYTVKSAGETITVELQTNVDYEIRIFADWVAEVQTRSFSSHVHTFTVAANGIYDSRTAEILFVNEEKGISEKVTITQAQQDAIVVEQSEYIVDAEGGTVEIEVFSNVNFTVQIGDTWIEQVTGTRALSSRILKFMVGENAGDESRTGAIVLKYDDIVVPITIVQKAPSSTFTGGGIDDIPVIPL